MKRIFLIFILGILSAKAQAEFIRESAKISLNNGVPISVHLKRPAKAAPGTLPVVLLFGGLHTGAKAIDLVDPGVPVLLATFEYPFEGPRKWKFPRDLEYIPKARQAMHDTVTGIRALVDWVAARPEVDASRITLVGASLGAPFVSIAAGENEKVSSLILVHGFADVPAVAKFSLTQEWKASLGIFAKPVAFVAGHLLWMYIGLPSPAEKLSQLKSHQRVLIFTAEGDDLLPPENAVKMRTALEKSAAQWEEKRLPGVHLRAGESELIKKFVHESLQWLG